MAHGQISLRDGCKGLLREDITHKPHILVTVKHPVVADHDARTFLSAVLQIEQAGVDHLCHIFPLRRQHTKNAAGFSNILHGSSLSGQKKERLVRRSKNLGVINVLVY